MKPDRKSILAKTNGRCAYCGDLVTGKFQVDHIISQRNFEWHLKNNHKVPAFLSHLKLSDLNHPDNLFAGCCSCNNYKSSMDLETFRKELGLLISRLNKTSTIYRISKRFGNVQEIQKPIVFYFETL